jgi:hypothetical protein
MLSATVLVLSIYLGCGRRCLVCEMRLCGWSTKFLLALTCLMAAQRTAMTFSCLEGSKRELDRRDCRSTWEVSFG